MVAMGMVVLHLGIGALQSGAIGAFFLPNVAAYVLGFGDFGHVLGQYLHVKIGFGIRYLY